QGALENLYRIEGAADVADFRIDRQALGMALGASADACRETLLVQQDAEETLIGLFLCDDVEAVAARFARWPHDEGLDAFCVAVEGVSHFVYFTYCGARQDRAVSRVELELQAEIDKFLVLRAVLGLSGSALRSRLYDDFVWGEGLSRAERARYRFANRHGRRYARWLDREFSAGRGSLALADARVLYRRPLEDKLSFIARPH
ncbi:MAG: hypothetical protein AAF449_13255, partial [Myxococcota bacterium]